MATNDENNQLIESVTQSIIKHLHSQIAKTVSQQVAEHLASLDLGQVVRSVLDKQLTDALKGSPVQITGDNVVGGIVKNFGSTGIQDSATTCQVTILDEATVVENTLVTSAMQVKGDLLVEGDLRLLGEIPTDSPFYRDMVEHAAGIVRLAMDGQFFLQYADKVIDQIKENGIDLSKIQFNGEDILAGNRLSYFITDTNIQHLGEVKELIVVGEADVFNTLSVRNKRIGINTTEPAGALSVWDDECEFLVKKLRKDVTIVGSARAQRVVLSSNNKNNIVLETDGSVSIEKLNVGAIQITSAGDCPKHVADRGVVAFNEMADVGEPAGWISIGAGKWASFGTLK